MAEINNQPSQQKHKHTVCNKKSTKVDLTPMVDLGFILITFFVFTSALAQPTVMELKVPNDQLIDIHDSICESCALTLILAENNQLYYYEGKEENLNLKTSNYSSKGIRQLIIDKHKKVKTIRGRDDMVLIIKPGDNSNFKNLINIVDECSINMLKRYYIAEITGKEKVEMEKMNTSINQQ